MEIKSYPSPHWEHFTSWCCEHERTMKTQQVFLLLHAAGHLHDGDGETVGRGCKHCWGQWHVVLVQELCSGRIRGAGFKHFAWRGSRFHWAHLSSKHKVKPGSWDRSKSSAVILTNCCQVYVFYSCPHPRGRTASSQSRRTCWCRWWCCSWSGGCSCRAPEFQSPVRWNVETWEDFALFNVYIYTFQAFAYIPVFSVLRCCRDCL